jgi:hypothetical protein
MTRHTKAYVTFVVAFFAVVIPLRSYAVPLFEINDVMIGSEAQVDIRIFGPEVSLLSQADRLLQDARFAQVSPLANDLTYFYRITNLDPNFASLTRLTMFKLADAPISSAGIIRNGSVTAASVFPTGILFNFAAFGGLSPSASPLDLFLTSSYVPKEDLPNGVLLVKSPGGTVSGNLLGPDDPMVVPEPGTLLLLGSGFLGLALLSRNTFIRQGRGGERS